MHTVSAMVRRMSYRPCAAVRKYQVVGNQFLAANMQRFSGQKGSLITQDIPYPAVKFGDRMSAGNA